jgi:hypothetical protein
MAQMTGAVQQDVDNQLLLAVRAIEHMCESTPKRKGDVTSGQATKLLEACHEATENAKDPEEVIRCLGIAAGILPLFNAPGRDAAIAGLEEVIERMQARL